MIQIIKKIILIINNVIEIRKKYKYGKLKIKKLLERANIKIDTSAIETILKEHNLYNIREKKHKWENAIYITESGKNVQKYNHFWNYKRIHSILDYYTLVLFFKKLRNS